MADRDWIKGYWSEARGNDPNFDRNLMRLNASVINAFTKKLGANFELFRDASFVADDWHSQAEEHLEASDFLIPILTPRYFERRRTRTELERFLGREEPMVFPILYMGDMRAWERADANNVSARDDELFRRISEFQFLDFRIHRFEPETPAATALISNFVDSIIARVPTPPARETPEAAERDSSLTPSPTDPTIDETFIPNKPLRAVKLSRPADMPGWHPLSSGYPPTWASGWGQDECGVFAEVTVEDVEFALRWCPKGSFVMGSHEDEAERFNDEGPQTEIQFSNGFWLGETTVTQALYKAVTGGQPSFFEGSENPVERVSWNDAKAFLEKLNQMVPGLDAHLPSEAQWEFACRAGTTEPFSPGVVSSSAGISPTTDEVNYDGNYSLDGSKKGEYRKRTVAVRGEPFRPNAWGLWHMHGNVWEWCEDVWSDGHEGASTNGSARQVSQQDGVQNRVLRGGSWGNSAGYCRAASRHRFDPEYRFINFGIRLARGQ